MKKSFVCAFAALAVYGLSSCQKEVVTSPVPMKEVTLNLGFETTKTYLNGDGKVYWGSKEHVQVFTEKKGIYDFVSNDSKVPSATFTGSIPVGDNIKYVLSITKTSTDGLEIDENDIISGTSIALTAQQNPSMAHSYKNGASCSIMKDSDAALKNVFGLVKMSFPAYESGQSKIHHVVISANENIAGRFSIDYTGNEPVASAIIDNSVAGKEITLTTRWASNMFESGDIYALMLPGTYTGFKMTVYPFESEPTSKDSYTLAEPFEITAAAPVVISRNKWIDAGTIPAEKGSSTDPGTGDGYPNDESALDYGLTEAWTATINGDKFPGYSSGAVFPAGGVTVDKVTYAEGVGFYGNRVQLGACYDWDKTTYSVNMPKKRFISFKINRPGTLSFIPYCSKDATIKIALVTKKNRIRSAIYAYETAAASYPNKNDESYRKTYEINASHLEGIEEAASVYIFSDSGGFNIFPITWTPAQPVAGVETAAVVPDYSAGFSL